MKTSTDHCQTNPQHKPFVTVCAYVLFLAGLITIFFVTFDTPYRFSAARLTRQLNEFSLRSSMLNDSYESLLSSYLPFMSNPKFSKFRCTGDENDIRVIEGRLCVFNNLCYNTLTDQFLYFSPTHPRKPLFYDSSKGMLYQFSETNSGTGFLSLSSDGSTPWSPIITHDSYPQTNVTTLHQLHSLMRIRFGGANIGHGLWEDFGSISYSMERMNVFDKNLVIMHHGPIPEQPLTPLYRQHIVPVLSPHPLVEVQNYTKSFKTHYVCFDHLLAGGQMTLFLKPRVKESNGREALFYHWRSKILQYHGLNPNFSPKRHHIIITNKSNSVWTRSGATRHRAIANLNDVVKFIRLTYPNISSEVVEWHKVPFDQQIGKLLNTTILITPCGGVSLIIPFLPVGAHAIVMDYYVNTPDHGYSVGQSGTMDGSFLNHIPHVQKQYYQVYGSADYQFDYPGARIAREDSSVVVNTTRLALLIDKALEEIGL